MTEELCLYGKLLSCTTKHNHYFAGVKEMLRLTLKLWWNRSGITAISTERTFFTSETPSEHFGEEKNKKEIFSEKITTTKFVNTPVLFQWNQLFSVLKKILKVFSVNDWFREGSGMASQVKIKERVDGFGLNLTDFWKGNLSALSLTEHPPIPSSVTSLWKY